MKFYRVQCIIFFYALPLYSMVQNQLIPMKPFLASNNPEIAITAQKNGADFLKHLATMRDEANKVHMNPELTNADKRLIEKLINYDTISHFWGTFNRRDPLYKEKCEQQWDCLNAKLDSLSFHKDQLRETIIWNQTCYPEYRNPEAIWPMLKEIVEVQKAIVADIDLLMPKIDILEKFDFEGGKYFFPPESKRDLYIRWVKKKN